MEHSIQVSERDGRIAKRDEYIALLGEELDELVVYAAGHGWKSKRFEEGERLRREIAEADAAAEAREKMEPGTKRKDDE